MYIIIANTLLWYVRLTFDSHSWLSRPHPLGCPCLSPKAAPTEWFVTVWRCSCTARAPSLSSFRACVRVKTCWVCYRLSLRAYRQWPSPRPRLLRYRSATIVCILWHYGSGCVQIGRRDRVGYHMNWVGGVIFEVKWHQGDQLDYVWRRDRD